MSGICLVLLMILRWPSPGPVEVSNCMATWNFEPNGWQLFSKMEIFICQKDQYGNLVPGLYEFDAEVVEKETNLSIPVADLHFEEVMAGIQLFSFSNLEPGNFLLTIYDIKHNKSISNMPYAYTVFVGVYYYVAKFGDGQSVSVRDYHLIDLLAISHYNFVNCFDPLLFFACSFTSFGTQGVRYRPSAVRVILVSDYSFCHKK